MPGPGLAIAGRALRPRMPGRPPTVVCIGFANRPKGYRLLPEAIDGVPSEAMARRDSRSTELYGGVRRRNTSGSALHRLSTMGDRVVVSQDVLKPADYAAWLQEADLVLLPYDPLAYGSRGSGVFTEARRLGIPVIATAGCAFARPAFDGGWGVAITDSLQRGRGQGRVAALARPGQPDPARGDRRAGTGPPPCRPGHGSRRHSEGKVRQIQPIDAICFRTARMSPIPPDSPCKPRQSCNILKR